MSGFAKVSYRGFCDCQGLGFRASGFSLAL